ncbi:hypothetical protein [Lysobacter sp. ESA13C]|uniref:hypothetical protein n=1 Tax=Lysobacter sp. ESA13C TaxID=2862676 RepID=UPI001CBABCD1|nr:hypothetical protein [Lysobacter sp. ESA13C]
MADHRREDAAWIFPFKEKRRCASPSSPHCRRCSRCRRALPNRRRPSFGLKPEGFGYPRSIAISPRPNSSRNIAHSTLIEFDELDRSPQVEAPERFNRRRLEALGAPRGRSL